MSNGVFVFGMLAKEDPVTWEVHVSVRWRERWVQAREDRSRSLGGVEVGGPNTSGEVGEGRQPTRKNKGGPCQQEPKGENHDVAKSA